MANVQMKLYKDELTKPSHLEKLNEIYNMFQEDQPKFISRQEVLNLKQVDNTKIFVFSSFDGPAFKHLRQLKARIISVFCILNSLKHGVKLPKSETPIFSHAMKDLSICCTNMEKGTREDIYTKVEMMRGRADKIFTEKVTHLVTAEVGSLKYHAAAQMKIPVMLPEWINQVWNDSEEDHIHGNDTRYQQYKCPIFYKYVICASGFNENKKSEIRKLVEEKGGGTYKGELICGTTTHLVLNEPKGEKFNHARMWKIVVVKSAWIYDSIEAGYCLPETNYVLEQQHTSTPTLESNGRTSSRAKTTDTTPAGLSTTIGDISLIPAAGVNGSMIRSINDTENYANRTLSITQQLNGTSLAKPAQAPAKPAGPNFGDMLKELNAIGRIDMNLFDSIGLYFEQFDAQVNERLKKLAVSGGAVRYDQFDSDVTHVIAHQVNEKQFKNYLDLNPVVNIVSIDWFINSCKNNDLQDCQDYFLYKNALSSVKTPKKKVRPEVTAEIKQIAAFNINKEVNDCLSQYVNSDMMSGISNPAATSRPSIQSNFNSNIQKYQQNEQQNCFKVPSTTSIVSATTSEASTVSRRSNGSTDSVQGIFANKRFQIIGFESDEVDKMIELLKQKGAKSVDYLDSEPSQSSFRRRELQQQIDYTLFPLTIPAPTSYPNPVTGYWMKQCIEKNQIIPVDESLFNQPIPRFNQDRPLANCVITVSNFNAAERDVIKTLCELLGAHVQPQLSVKDAGAIRTNTHLICNQPMGPKYAAAKSWGLPIVCLEWLVETCVVGAKSDESKYSIENSGLFEKDLIESLSKIRHPTDDMSTMSTNGNNQNTSIRSANTSRLGNMDDFQYDNHETSWRQRDAKDHNNSELDIDPRDKSKHNDSSLIYTEPKKPRLDTPPCENRRASLVNEPETSSDADILMAAMENSYKMRRTTMGGAANRGVEITPINPRLKELRRTETPVSHNNNNKSLQNPSSPAFGGADKASFSTPVWLKSNDPNQMKFNFDFELALDQLKTPAAEKSQLLQQMKNAAAEAGCDTPLDELFKQAIKIACEKNRKGQFQFDPDDSPQFEYSFMRRKREKDELNGNSADNRSNNPFSRRQMGDDDDRIPCTPAHLKILHHVNVYVCKKLFKHQDELRQLVEHLGGEFSWTYDGQCTHFVYSGKLSDNNKELNAAREGNKIIVTPEWLYACKQESRRVDEKFYSVDGELHEQMDSEDSNQREVTGNNNETVEMSGATAEVDKDEELKRAMLDKLQDQLEKIGRQGKNTTLPKKFTRNKSNDNTINKSVDDSKTANQTIPDSDETAILQQLQFNELSNKENCGENNNSSSARKRKASSGGRSMSGGNEENMSLKESLKNKLAIPDSNLEDMCTNNMLMPSQVQVTLWKDSCDTTNSTTSTRGPKPTTTSMNRAQRNGSTGSASKSDAIAERIVHATRLRKS